MMRVQTLNRPGTAEEEIKRMLTHSPSITGSSRMEAIRKAEKAVEGNKLFDRLKCIVEPMMDKELVRPEFRDASSFAKGIAEQIVGNRVGRLAYEGENARFHWFTKRKMRGIMNNDYALEKHEHLILKPRFELLPSNREMPAEAKRIHDAICEEPALRDITRIMYGDLLGESHADVEEWSERTQFGNAVDAVGRSVKGAAQATKQAVQSGVRTLANAPAAIANAFENDPAILIGSDIVLYGWK